MFKQVIMDYEKKYKDALEKAKSIIDDLRKGEDILAVSDLESMFPELAESEDERIRKRLICGMNALKDQKKETFAAIPIGDCIAWLEKQGGQKWSEEGIREAQLDYWRSVGGKE